jgi:coproporphyrinogen III oxidase-like Fe-S oxidoreductase
MNEQFGIYVHWPFCAAKCPYCDFNSHVAETIDHNAWRKAYAREIHAYGRMAKGREVTSIFFGGGTPSLMEPATAQVVIDEIAKHWNISNDCEITLEANPTSVETEKFKSFRSAGINRVSMGVQSLNEQDLSFLGRIPLTLSTQGRSKARRRGRRSCVRRSNWQATIFRSTN